jgi:hypothetical protein
MKPYCAFVQSEGVKLDSYHRNRSIQKSYDIKESACDLLSNDNSLMIELWPSLTFDVPVLDCPYYVALINATEHNLDFVVRFSLGIPHQEIYPTSDGLPMLTRRDLKLSEA